ncbi:MAG TPA: hypothetical protein VLS90_04460 [Thermodesulfobacteriota bacterium]|nr:hypothetical protein [Thermodesulfobacteriota bacterium]
MILRPEARFGAALELKRNGLPLGELFTFLSGLYFRGKLAYASAFADPPEGCPGVLVITPCRGLLPPDTKVTADDLRLFASTDVHEEIEAYARPLARDARRLCRSARSHADFILLGSIATAKYVKVLMEVFGVRLKFPVDFVGRGDMSRGGLLLRRARSGEELEYASVQGAVLHGKKPPKLAPLKRSRKEL